MSSSSGGAEVALTPEANAFLGEIFGADFKVARASEDASFRSYYRVHSQRGPFIFMDAPPDKEDSSPFVDIARFLATHGVPVPRIHEARLGDGHLLLEDLGDVTYLKALAEGVDPGVLYQEAVTTLLDIQATPNDSSSIAHRRTYDRPMLRRELALFTDWYVEGIRKTPISSPDRDRFEEIFQLLLDQALSQPEVFVHRDYHCRNLMWRGEGGAAAVGVIDFQDAVMGPVTYDLASLLRDCYVAWDGDFRRRVMTQWLAGAGARLGYEPSWERFERDFDWMAIQRNMKAIGIFGRLSLRDGKHGYLNDIPRTMGYVRETLERYPELSDLGHLLDRYAPLEAA
ncbi:MAG: phosphotransferase [Magnetococcales bacterium]|nr:phosphotransferase [Magnetococcales bacterium]